MTKPPINLPLHKSVTARISDISQPRGGYLNPKALEAVCLGDGIETLFPDENVHANIVGMAVDYLTRFMTGSSLEDAFKISILGAEKAQQLSNAEELLRKVTGIDYESIVCACKLVGYDSAHRAGMAYFRPVDDIVADEQTAKNIAEMVKRSMSFFDVVGEKTLDGFDLKGAYTDYVSAGDGDFLTKDTLWDFKVSKSKPAVRDTLQLLMYWQMGLRSIHAEFSDVEKLGIFNPRLNTMYTIKTELIDSFVIDEVCDKVIGYGF